MNKITNEEIQAFYNELNEMKLQLKKDLKNGKITRSEVGSIEIIRWLDGYNDFSHILPKDRDRAIKLLFKNKEKDLKRRKIVIEALISTKDPKLVELAEKMEMFSSRFPLNESEKMELAKIVLYTSRGSSNRAAEKDYSFKYDGNGKTYTVGKELKEIKKRYEKLKKDERKKQNKYTNISNISIDRLYREVEKFLKSHNYWLDFESILSETIDWDFNKKKIINTIQENQREAIEMFYEQEELKFIRSQKAGKIR